MKRLTDAEKIVPCPICDERPGQPCDHKGARAHRLQLTTLRKIREIVHEQEDR